MLCVGQCEYSFSETYVMLMNKKEMEDTWKSMYVSWEEGVDSGRSPSLAHEYILVSNQ